MKKFYLFSFLFFCFSKSFSQVVLTPSLPHIITSSSTISYDISADGLTTVIGFPSYGPGNSIGMVKVLKYISGNWTQLGAEIPGEEAASEFGTTVSISDDGLTIAIGTPKKIVGLWGTGYVKIYRFISGAWTQLGSDILGQNSNGFFGAKLKLSGDGNTVIISARFTVNSTFGYARVYNYSAGNWIQMGSDISGYFSAIPNVDISHNGYRVAIATRIYNFVSGQWIGESTPFVGSEYTVSLSGDGSTVVYGGGHRFEIYKKDWLDNWQYSYNEGFTGYYDVTVSTSFDGNTVAVQDPSNGIIKMYRLMNDSWEYFAQIPVNTSKIKLSSDKTKLSTYSQIQMPNGGLQRGITMYDMSSMLGSESFDSNVFFIYPNPAKNEINITLKDSFTLEKINLYNLLGQKINETNSYTMNVSNYPKGSYMVEVVTDKGSTVKKVILE